MVETTPFERSRARKCPICAEREDLKGRLRHSQPRDPARHGITAHTEIAQLAWELGLYREDNPDEWRELERLTRLPKEETK